MRTLRQVYFTILLTITAFSLTTYMACKKDKCKDKVCKTGEVCTNGVCRNTQCDNVTCQNGGQCVKGVCKCIEGYLGDNCEKLFGGKFIGSYTASEQCNGNTKIYDVNITTLTSARVQFRIDNIGNYQIDFSIAIADDENSFTFYNAEEGYEFVGSGVFNNGNVEIAYNVIPLGLTPMSCTGTWTKNN